MSRALLPARGEAPPAAGGRELAGLAAATLLLAALFWAPLLLGGPLSGHDWSSHHFHYFDWVRISMREHSTFPLFLWDAWITPNFLANAEAPSLGPLVPLLALLPTGVYLKLLIVSHTAAGLAGGWLLLRELGVAAPLAALGAGAFAWGGFFTAHLAVGHHWAMGALLLPLLLLLYRRAAHGSFGALAGAALLGAFTIGGGQHQPFIWQNLFLLAWAALWALWQRALFPLRTLALLWLATAALGAIKLLPLWLEFRDYAPEARIAGLPWSSLLPSLLDFRLGPGAARPGLAYAHGAGWWEYSFYLGAPALALLALGAAAARGAWPVLLLALGLGLCALEPSGLWPLLADLPILRTQRVPSRFLVLALFALLLVAAPGLERLRAALAARRPRLAGALAWGLALLVAGDLFHASLVWQRAASGAAIESLAHRPRPERLAQGGVRAELVEFAPNRLVYRVRAERPGTLTLPLRNRAPDRWSAGALRPGARGEWLSLELPAGERHVALVYRPAGLAAGAGISALTGLVLFSLLRRRARSRP